MYLFHVHICINLVLVHETGVGLIRAIEILIACTGVTDACMKMTSNHVFLHLQLLLFGSMMRNIMVPLLPLSSANMFRPHVMFVQH